MLRPRVIPALLLSNEGLTKTFQFKKRKYIGDPVNAIRIFNEKAVDELLVIDIEASRNNKEPNYKLIENFASECFMPLTYGGGINSLLQAERIFSLGVEKICIQSAALYNPRFVTELSKRFGTQSISVSLDVKKNWWGKYKLRVASSAKTLKTPLNEQLKRVAQAGAGEIILNSIDKDGTMSGPDLVLIKTASESLNIPLVAVGGISSLADIKSAIESGADAVGVGSFFVFHGPHRAVLITYPDDRELKNISGVE